MKRREFNKKIISVAGSSLVLPFILPGGRLFAASGNRSVEHVVLCLFAGGVRNIESIHQAEGNLMQSTFTGTPKISSDIAHSIDPIPRLMETPLQKMGTLYREFRFQKGPTAHISAHLAAISGTYILNGTNAKHRPDQPTVFELFRKHGDVGKNALNTWLITDRSDPYMLFNYSKDPDYGARYGANFMQPESLLRNSIGKVNTSELFKDQEKTSISKIRMMLNQGFSESYNMEDAGFINEEEDAYRLKSFIRNMVDSCSNGDCDDPWKLGEFMNRDMTNIYFAEKILTHFKPRLTVVNMFEIDRGHTDFSLYCNNIRKADYALAHLWDTIQKTSGLADNTVLIAVPEHGRNLKPNTLLDINGRYALDHTSDPTSREIFCLILGPKGVIKQDHVVKEIKGESIDIVPTIAKLLGFHHSIPPWILKGKVLEDVFC